MTVTPPNRKFQKLQILQKFPQNNERLLLGNERLVLLGNERLLLGNERLLLGIIGVFGFLGFSFFLLLGGFRTPWVGGPRTSFLAVFSCFVS